MNPNHKKQILSLMIAIIATTWMMISHANTIISSLISEDELKNILLHSNIPKYQYQIIHIYPHDNSSFTEGLVFENNFLYESTGLYKKSKLRKIQLTTGKIIKQFDLPDHYFGEGMTIYKNRIYQLTYQEHLGFIYDKKTFALKQIFSYPTEGWGLTSDEHQLIMSDGSAMLTFINPTTMKSDHSIMVTLTKKRINGLNELQFVHGKIFANVWLTTLILIISPETGKVEGWLNIKALKPNQGICKMDISECVANGIAYDKDNQILMVTGKNWPHVYALKLVKY